MEKVKSVHVFFTFRGGTVFKTLEVQTNKNEQYILKCLRFLNLSNCNKNISDIKIIKIEEVKILGLK